MTKYQVTLQGDSWAEVVQAARDVIGGAQPAAAPLGQGLVIGAGAPGPLPPPQPLPFAKPTSGLIPPPEYVCPEHNQPMRHKPAGVNRQGTPYAAGFRCPVSGCRQFVPDAQAVPA